jgi:small nuclear ribonucleoprotein D3
MNCRLENATMVTAEGKRQHFDQVYLRGSQIKFIVVPDMFKNAPMFKRVKAQSKQRNAALLREKYQQYKRTPSISPHRT